jgi:hypothetical protein
MPEYINPIDPDKVAEYPGLMEYGHHIGSPVIKAADKGKIKSNALAAMREQTSVQFEQIKSQMELLVVQAKKIQDRIHISNEIYEAEMKIDPIIGHTYYLYARANGQRVLSMVPNDGWGRSFPFTEFLAKVKLLSDHTWDTLD